MPKAKRHRHQFSSNTLFWPARPSNCHRCRALHDDSVAAQLVPKPQTSLAWRSTENQRFVDPSRYPADHPLDGDNDNSSEDNDDDDESEDSLTEVVTDKEADATRQATIATPTSDQEVEHDPAAIASCVTKPEEDAVLRFLDVVEDHDAHRSSVERLREFFDDASLERLRNDREGIEGGTGCQTVLDDRNFTSRLYRRYKRPLGPVEVYEKLMEKVAAPLAPIPLP